MLRTNVRIQEGRSGFDPKGLRRDKRGLEVVTNGFNGLAGKRFHFIGVGGIGMSGLAMLMLKHKAIVTGSDQTPGETIDQLSQSGADIKIGHKEHNLNPAADAVVISAAIKEENPELKLARREGIRVYKYAEMLGKVFQFYQGIAISGTHGKSTTSGWLAYLLKVAGLEPNFVVGAVVTQLAGSSGVGSGNHFVAEACEYDRSFLNLKSQIAVILNIEADHLVAQVGETGARHQSDITRADYRHFHYSSPLELASPHQVKEQSAQHDIRIQARHHIVEHHPVTAGQNLQTPDRVRLPDIEQAEQEKRRQQNAQQRPAAMRQRQQRHRPEKTRHLVDDDAVAVLLAE